MFEDPAERPGAAPEVHAPDPDAEPSLEPSLPEAPDGPTLDEFLAPEEVPVLSEASEWPTGEIYPEHLRPEVSETQGAPVGAEAEPVLTPAERIQRVLERARLVDPEAVAEYERGRAAAAAAPGERPPHHADRARQAVQGAPAVRPAPQLDPPTEEIQYPEQERWGAGGPGAARAPRPRWPFPRRQSTPEDPEAEQRRRDAQAERTRAAEAAKDAADQEKRKRADAKRDAKAADERRRADKKAQAARERAANKLSAQQEKLRRERDKEAAKRADEARRARARLENEARIENLERDRASQRRAERGRLRALAEPRVEAMMKELDDQHRADWGKPAHQRELTVQSVDDHNYDLVRGAEELLMDELGVRPGHPIVTQRRRHSRTIRSDETVLRWLVPKEPDRRGNRPERQVYRTLRPDVALVIDRSDARSRRREAAERIWVVRLPSEAFVRNKKGEWEESPALRDWRRNATMQIDAMDHEIPLELQANPEALPLDPDRVLPHESHPHAKHGAAEQADTAQREATRRWLAEQTAAEAAGRQQVDGEAGQRARQWERRASELIRSGGNVAHGNELMSMLVEEMRNRGENRVVEYVTRLREDAANEIVALGLRSRAEIDADPRWVDQEQGWMGRELAEQRWYATNPNTAPLPPTWYHDQPPTPDPNRPALTEEEKRLPANNKPELYYATIANPFDARPDKLREITHRRLGLEFEFALRHNPQGLANMDRKLVALGQRMIGGGPAIDYRAPVDGFPATLPEDVRQPAELDRGRGQLTDRALADLGNALNTEYQRMQIMAQPVVVLLTEGYSGEASVAARNAQLSSGKGRDIVRTAAEVGASGNGRFANTEAMTSFVGQQVREPARNLLAGAGFPISKETRSLSWALYDTAEARFDAVEGLGGEENARGRIPELMLIDPFSDPTPPGEAKKPADTKREQIVMRRVGYETIVDVFGRGAVGAARAQERLAGKAEAVAAQTKIDEAREAWVNKLSPDNRTEFTRLLDSVSFDANGLPDQAGAEAIGRALETYTPRYGVEGNLKSELQLDRLAASLNDRLDTIIPVLSAKQKPNPQAYQRDLNELIKRAAMGGFILRAGDGWAPVTVAADAPHFGSADFVSRAQAVQAEIDLMRPRGDRGNADPDTGTPDRDDDDDDMGDTNSGDADGDGPDGSAAGGRTGGRRTRRSDRAGNNQRRDRPQGGAEQSGDQAGDTSGAGDTPDAGDQGDAPQPTPPPSPRPWPVPRDPRRGGSGARPSRPQPDGAEAGADGDGATPPDTGGPAT